MKIYVEVFNIDNKWILSKNIMFDGGYYDIHAMWRFWAKLDGLVTQRKAPNIKLLPTERTKKFTITIAMGNDGEYLLIDSKDKITRLNTDIINDVADFFRIPPEDMFIKSRKPRILKPRHFAILLIWLVNRESLSSVSKLFDQNHATTIHIIRNSIPSFYISNEPIIVQAIDYFSQKYDVDIRKYVLNLKDVKTSEIIR